MASWIGIDSSHLSSVCGEAVSPNTLAEALNGTGPGWIHYTNEVHEFITDLSVLYNITKFKARSQNLADPNDIDIFVSANGVDWGAAVASGISTWKDTTSFVEVDTTDKIGRYIKVVINGTEHASDWLAWGTGSNVTIFDIYGELVISETIVPDVLALELELLAPTLTGTLETVSPDVLALELELLAPTLTGTLETVSPDVLALELELLAPRVGPVFPTFSTSPEYEGWVDEYGDETVVRGSYASGYPLLNPQFTFDSKNFRYVMRRVSQADKETVVEFYNDNKSQEMFWLNEQDDVTYFVVFVRKPRCQSDGAKNLWRLEINLKQVAEL